MPLSVGLRGIEKSHKHAFILVYRYADKEIMV